MSGGGAPAGGARVRIKGRKGSVLRFLIISVRRACFCICACVCLCVCRPGARRAGLTVHSAHVHTVWTKVDAPPPSQDQRC
jgi:hypothetical protein